MTDLGYLMRREFRPGSVAHPRRIAVLARLDWVLLTSVLLLTAVGSLLVWSATRVRLERAGEPTDQFLQRHLLTVGLGLVLAVLMARLDYRRLRGAAPAIYAVSLIGLVLVLGPLGATVNGSDSWIRLAGQSIQPSEFAKLALVMMLAVVLAGSRFGGRKGPPGRDDVLKALALAAVPVGLVILQPDLGTVMVIGVIVVAMILISGASMGWVVALGVVAAVGAVTIARLHLLSQYQLNRFAAFTNPALDPQGAGYNANQARIAIGSGGLFGTGLFEGAQTSGQFVPEQHTDFIFTVAGEELGFVGAGAIIALLGILLWRACRISLRARDSLAALLAGGIAVWIGFQVFENIGMTLGIMPIAGLPLPFVSYGGTAMFANLAAVGILQGIHLRRREVSPPEAGP
ncbi:MAG TPA: rod shape-determining protein RodA [Actinomycetes bacterium]|nr:rod shape-determining protein RodA [Actinomycetes bacterium]